MSNQSIVIDLPENIYEEYKRRAEQTHRSVEAEIKAVITKDVVEDENEDNDGNEDEKLSPELQKLVDQLAFLDINHLTRLATKTFPKKEAARIESLHFKQQNDGLTDKEKSDLVELMKKFDRWFVLRNVALGKLFESGVDVNNFVPKK